MSKPIENCPQPDEPMRDRAWTAEQVAARYATDLRHLIYLDAQFNMCGETDLKLPEMQALEARGWIAEGEENAEYNITEEGERIIVATLRQQTTNPPEIGSKLVDGGVVSDAWRDAIKSAADALAYAAFNIDGSKQEDLRPGITESTGAAETALIAERDLRAMLAAAPLLRAPAEGHEVKVLSHDGECWTVGKWEQQEGAYVTHDAIRLRDAPAEQGGRVDGFEDWWERTESDVSSPHDAAKSAWQAALAQNAHREVVACWRIYGGRWTSGEPPVDAVKNAERTGEKIELAYFHAERARVPASLCAKPIVWSGPEHAEWWDDRHGFHIGHDPDEDQPFIATWGEGEPEGFATLDEAKAWCQGEIDDWVRGIVVLAAAPSQPEGAEVES